MGAGKQTERTPSDTRQRCSHRSRAVLSNPDSFAFYYVRVVSEWLSAKLTIDRQQSQNAYASITVYTKLEQATSARLSEV